MIDNQPVAWIKQNPETLEPELHFDKPAKYWATVVSNPDIPLYTQETIEEIKALWYSKGHADGAKIRDDYLALRTFDGKKE